MHGARKLARLMLRPRPCICGATQLSSRVHACSSLAGGGRDGELCGPRLEHAAWPVELLSGAELGAHTGGSAGLGPLLLCVDTTAADSAGVNGGGYSRWDEGGAVGDVSLLPGNALFGGGTSTHPFNAAC
jgi:hypothetical protein